MQEPSIEVFLEDEPGRMVYIFKGAPSCRDVEAALQEAAGLLKATGNVRHYRQALVDVSDGTINLISPDEQRHLFDYAAALREDLGLPAEGSRLAIVVAADVDFGMGRIVEMRGEIVTPGILRAVFRSAAEAYHWLETPDGTANSAPTV